MIAAALMRLLMLIGVASVALLAQHTPTPASIAAIVERELKAARVPGASYAIVSGSDVATGAYGLADAGRGTPMGADTLVHVGSLTKLLTALAVVAALEAEGLPLTTPVGRHLAGVTPRLAVTTYHELLSHTAGLRDKRGQQGAVDERALYDGVRAIAPSDFLLPRGTVFSYSNLGYAAAGAALERLRRKPFADALRDGALEPLGMTTASMRPTEIAAGKRAAGHRLDEGSPVAIREADVDTSLWPAGYLWASAVDMSHVLRILIDPSKRLTKLKPSVINRVLGAHAGMPNVFPGGHYGYGVMLGHDRGTRIYEHGGTQTGFASILRAAPDRRFGVVILTNLDGAPLRRVAQTVTGEALGLRDTSPPAASDAAVTPSELGVLMGVYRNRGTAEVAARDGRVVLMLDGGAPLAVSRIGPTRYLARPKADVRGPEFVLRPATASAPAYLHFGLWAYVK